MERLKDYPAPLINDWNLIFNILILIKSYLNEQNNLSINTTSTHNFWLHVFYEILDNIESKFFNT